MKTIMIFFGLFFLSFPIHAGTVENDAEYQMILGLMQLIPGRELPFTETKMIDVLDMSIESKGVLLLNNDGSLSRRIKSTGEVFIISDTGLSRTFAGKEKNISFSDNPAAYHFGVALRALYTSDIETLREYFAFSLLKNNDAWTLMLKTTEQSLSRILRVITLVGKSDNLLYVETLQGNGDRVITRYSSNNK
ncbi:MAG: hypothetical protein JKY93_05445 [Gammaproteobacteria bacterium]|nr:hypothetical protein [Gammaproteobacteria bacterium]